jgi:hypothetical protein
VAGVAPETTCAIRQWLMLGQPDLVGFIKRRTRYTQPVLVRKKKSIDRGFTHSELDAGHDVMLTAPSLAAERLSTVVG